jgi:hypothetical protein
MGTLLMRWWSSFSLEVNARSGEESGLLAELENFGEVGKARPPTLLLLRTWERAAAAVAERSLVLLLAAAVVMVVMMGEWDSLEGADAVLWSSRGEGRGGRVSGLRGVIAGSGRRADGEGSEHHLRRWTCGARGVGTSVGRRGKEVEFPGGLVVRTGSVE